MFAKSKLVRLALTVCLALPIGYALLQPNEASAAVFYGRRPIIRPIVPIVRVGPVVPVGPVAPIVSVGPVVPVGPVYPWYPGYGWRWNGYRWVR